MLCKSLSHYAAQVLSKTFYLEARALVEPFTNFNVESVIDQEYTLLKRVNIYIDDTLAILLQEPLRIIFTESTPFYCVFYNRQYDLVVIPNWCTQVIIGIASQTFSVESRERNNLNELKVEGHESLLQVSKFDIIMEDKNGYGINRKKV